jgi:hypothetical protein
MLWKKKEAKKPDYQKEAKDLRKQIEDLSRQISEKDATIKDRDARILLLESNFTDINYKDWQQDFGFLSLLLSRKEKKAAEMYIQMLSQQNGDDATIKDDQLEEVIQRVVMDVYSSLSMPYRVYMSEKYFGSNENLLSYITEDVYTNLSMTAIDSNTEKAKKVFNKQRMDTIKRLNEQEKEGKR